MKVALAGEGAIGRKHLDAIAQIDDVEVGLLIGKEPDAVARVAAEYGITETADDLGEALNRTDIDAVILATPTPLHAEQAVEVLRAGKHVLVEIPVSESLADARAVAEAAEESGAVAMVAHTRRFNPGHRWLHRQFESGELVLQHLVAETFFFRRENINANGEPRTWNDHLLWHHACHSVDLFAHQTGAPVAAVQGFAGPVSETMGIYTDLSVSAASESGALLSLAVSFNNDGPLGTTFRYICDKGTFIARYDDLVDGYGNPVDTGEDAAMDGIRRQDEEFAEAIRQGREPESSAAQAVATMELLDRIERSLPAVR
ncbi:hypothetical protein KACC15558_20790 [Brevibacterium ammoniilyticum]|uniref:Gfo/Idh/MocA family oxidoreductase n=1 Tax=Brevibacterium ammoniilyticum TaxID=1046555 RepID=A0ABP9U1L9_9MICO